MGYDCTLHLVDEDALRREFVPRLLTPAPPRTMLDRLLGHKAAWPPTALDRRRPDAPRLWKKARRALRLTAPETSVRFVCEMAILYSSCELPSLSSRAIALSLWPMEKDSPPLTGDLLGSPEDVLFDLLARYPALHGAFPEGFDGNVSPGIYVPAVKVGALARFVAQWVGTLRPDVARHYLPLQRILHVAAREGFGYWEATDLDVEQVASDLLDAPRPAPSRAAPVQKHLLPFPARVTAAVSGPRLLVSDNGTMRTALISFNAWPPAVGAQASVYTLSAAEARDGRWALVSTAERGPFHGQLRVGGTSLGGLRVLPLAAGEKVAPKVAAWIGDVPAALTAQGLVLARGDFLEPAGGLPAPLPMSEAMRHALPAQGTLRLGNGGDVIVWDGHGYEWRDGALVRTLALDADPSSIDWTAAPWGSDGVFFLSGRWLYACRRGQAPVRHARAVDNVMAIAPGPEGTVLLSQGDNPENDAAKIYDPATRTVLSIPPEAVGETAEHEIHFDALHWIPEADLVVLRALSTLRALRWRDLRDRDRRPADTAEPKSVEVRGGAAWDALSDSWRDGVEARLHRGWYLEARKLPGKAGQTVIAFRIQMDGTLGHASVDRASGWPAADLVAQAALKAASPCRPVPSGETLDVVATFTPQRER